MRNLKSILVLCLVSTALFASSSGENEMQIQKFRFNRHVKLGFERLVIEFANKGISKSAPTIRLVPDNSGKETTIHVSQANLVGAIPEASINESYIKKSQYFGPVSISSDSSNGFEIRTFIKQSHSIVDAFWLEKPSRLIVDVFPKTSDRAQGPNIVVKRTTASVGSKAENQRMGSDGKSAEKEAAPAWTQMDKPSDESVLCFPANTQVKANIGFEKGTGASSASNNVDSTYGAAGSNTQDLIVCYPKGAQVTPHLKFAPTESSFYGRADMDNKNNNNRNPSSVPFYPGNGGGYQPAPMPMMGYPSPNFYAPPPARFAPQPNLGSRDSFMNNDADLALSGPDEGSKMGYQESFSQKAPPMSLGKKLVPPGQR